MIRRTALQVLAGGLVGARPVAGAVSAHVAGDGVTPLALTSFPNGVEIGQLSFIPPSGDTTGVTDQSAIQSALGAGGSVQLLPGDYYLNAPVSVNQVVNSGTRIPVNYGALLAGRGPATRLIPAGAITGQLVTLGLGGMLVDLSFYGGSAVTTAVDGISVVSTPPNVAAGYQAATEMYVENVTAANLTGWILSAPQIGSVLHLSVKGIRGMHNAGGVQLSASAGVSAQVALVDVDIQQCQVNSALYLQNVYDVSVHGLNCAVSGAAAVPTIDLVGDVATALFCAVDAGVFPATTSASTPVLRLRQGTSGTATVSPSDISFSGGTIQQGGVGIAVNDNCARIRFSGIMAKTNLTDGWQFNGTGTAISVTGCSGNGNGQNAGTTTQDVFVASSAHVGLFGFSYCSTKVANALQLAGSTNHVTNDNPTFPGGKSVVGTPGGW